MNVSSVTYCSVSSAYRSYNPEKCHELVLRSHFSSEHIILASVHLKNPCVKKVFYVLLYPQATFKRYQSDHKLKQDSLERSKTDLKKLRRKSQGKHSSKYEIRENEVSPNRSNIPSLQTCIHSPNSLHGFTSICTVAFLCSDAREKNMTSVQFM